MLIIYERCSGNVRQSEKDIFPAGSVVFISVHNFFLFESSAAQYPYTSQGKQMEYKFDELVRSNGIGYATGNYSQINYYNFTDNLCLASIVYYGNDTVMNIPNERNFFYYTMDVFLHPLYFLAVRGSPQPLGWPQVNVTMLSELNDRTFETVTLLEPIYLATSTVVNATTTTQEKGKISLGLGDGYVNTDKLVVTQDYSNGGNYSEPEFCCAH